MITREEMQAVIKKKERQASKEIKTTAANVISNASSLIKRGRFTIPNAPTSPEVFNLVQKSFKKEGIDVKMEIKEVRSRSTNKLAYTKQQATYRFSLAEEV